MRCNVATCWQVELSILSLLQLSFNIHSSNWFSCPIKFFHLVLGWPWANLGALLVQPQKKPDVQCLPLPVSPGRLSLANLQGACAMETNTMASWHWSRQVKFRPSWLFHKGCLSLHSWWDAMLARKGTCWVWDVLAFSLLHLSFIGTIASVVLSSGILGRCLRNHRKTRVSSVYLCLFPREGFPRQTYIKQVGWKHSWIKFRL